MLSRDNKGHDELQIDTDVVDKTSDYFSSSELDHPLAYYLTDDSFYLDQNGHLVIVFNEGDIGPMSSGTLSFTIPDEAIAGIRK